MPQAFDYGHQIALHVVDYYLFREVREIVGTCSWPPEAPRDFDFEVERREGWGYQDA